MSDIDMINMELNHSKLLHGNTTQIMRVPGGWIYTLWLNNVDGTIGTCNSVFVPEPQQKESSHE